jgi:hypothetical protein
MFKPLKFSLITSHASSIASNTGFFSPHTSNGLIISQIFNVQKALMFDYIQRHNLSTGTSLTSPL